MNKGIAEIAITTMQKPINVQSKQQGCKSSEAFFIQIVIIYYCKSAEAFFMQKCRSFFIQKSHLNFVKFIFV